MTSSNVQHDVIIDRDSGDSGFGMGALVGVVLAILVVLAIIWFLFLGGYSGNNNQPPYQPPIQLTQPPAQP